MVLPEQHRAAIARNQRLLWLLPLFALVEIAAGAWQHAASPAPIPAAPAPGAVR